MEELEKARQKAVKVQLIGAGVSILVTIIFAMVYGVSYFLVFALMTGAIISYLISVKDIKTFNNLYKQQIVVKSFNDMFEYVKFDLNNGISRYVIAETEMMNMGDKFTSNDHVLGVYKGINVEMSDVQIEEMYTDSDGKSYYITVFKGQWYIFDFNKPFKADLQVCARGFTNARRGSLFRKSKFKKVELEDMQFNKNFKVYALSELDAFFVLTPNTMERIKEVDRRTKGKLLLCFIDNKLHIGLHNSQDLFEASIYKKVDLEEATRKVKSEISIITNFVDILKLDNDLFKSKKEV